MAVKNYEEYLKNYKNKKNMGGMFSMSFVYDQLSLSYTDPV